MNGTYWYLLGGLGGGTEASTPESATGLIYPFGRIHPDLFPERSPEQLEADVGIWLEEGYAHPLVATLDEATQHSAAAEWAYYRAFDAVCIAMAANPNTHAQTDAGTSQYAKDQRDTICGAASAAGARFNEIVSMVAVVERRTGGQTVGHQFAW